MVIKMIEIRIEKKNEVVRKVWDFLEKEFKGKKFKYIEIEKGLLDVIWMLRCEMYERYEEI